MGDQERLTALFTDYAPRVYAYARRHCDPVAAQDVVSETFLVAWRRRDDLPDNPLPWLLKAARFTIANARRRETRADRLWDSIAQVAHIMPHPSGAEHEVLERDAMLEALGTLSNLEREALFLVAWDGLSAREAAEVADCSVRAFEVRLSRARARLSAALSHQNAIHSSEVVKLAKVAADSSVTSLVPGRP